MVSADLIGCSVMTPVLTSTTASMEWVSNPGSMRRGTLKMIINAGLRIDSRSGLTQLFVPISIRHPFLPEASLLCARRGLRQPPQPQISRAFPP